MRLNRSAVTVLCVAAAAMGVVAVNVAQHTIAIVSAKGLLPRWDLAAHLGHGWLDYHYLVTGQLHLLVWDLWLQGYWPPLLSILQVPFYVITGGKLTGGLWSSLATFVTVGVMGTAILWRQWGTAALLPASIFVGLLVTSPFMQAYGSVAMTEMLGALTQLAVVYAYLVYRHRPTAGSARWLAISLSLLFFTKYNYFLLLIGPLVIHEWLEFTAGFTLAQRIRHLGVVIRRVLSSPTGLFVTIAALVVAVIISTGGFETRVLGQRVSVRSIGNAGHIVLYVVLARLWFLHIRRRIDWAHLRALDPRVRPMLVWFVTPVTIWLAAPYPNHLRDFFNLIINRPMGEATVGGGISVYADALRSSYFHNEWLLAATVVAVMLATVAYRRHSPTFQWLILAVPLQLFAIASHQTRFPRFLLLTVVLLMLVGASEVGRWCAVSTRRRMAAAWLAPLVLAGSLVTSRFVVTSEPFRSVAFELYTDSASLRAALESIRGGLSAQDRLAVVGHNNDLSPGLFNWTLGPPSGVPCFPISLSGAQRQDLSVATQVVLLENVGHVSALDDVSYYTTHRDAVLASVERGELRLRRDFPLPDLSVAMQLYERIVPANGSPACR